MFSPASTNEESENAHTATIEVPRRFSFIEEPREALRFVTDLVNASRNRKTEEIWIDQRRCELIDLGAEAVASALLMEIRKRFRLKLNGAFPASQEQKEIVWATGMPHALGLVSGRPEEFTALDLFNGRKAFGGLKRTNAKELQTTEMVEYLNRCFAEYGFELTPDSAEYVSSLVGEVIGNAEDHGGRGDWWIAGYLRRPKDQPYGDCHLTIFNFGETLFESLKRLPPGSRLRTDIEIKVNKHTSRGFFKKRSWTPENLWTLYALQGGVSRFNDHPEYLGHRGTGTVRMIEFFQDMNSSAAPAKMCVVSGNTYILFDGEYKMRPEPTDSGQVRRVIAFNDDNDLDQPPNPDYVHQIKGWFPGTLVSLRFYLDGDDLAKIAKGAT